MIIHPECFVVLRCTSCGKQLLYRSLSAFALHGEGMKLTCSCGNTPMALRSPGKYYYLSVACPVCGEDHDYIFAANDLRGDTPIALECEESGVHLAYLGERAAVLTALNDAGGSIRTYEDALADYFLAPQLMAGAIVHLNRLIGRSDLRCGACASQGAPWEDFNIEVGSDRIIIACAHCGSQVTIYVRRPMDLHLFRKIERIILTEGSPRIRYLRQRARHICLRHNG